ncbi:hypothetical protein K438DRAFT_1761473 [Mycena galopus ATCC 62051]|nr:hypothetical protein K438DRAFT_1761473 [Mycena galopus ATCC 62051]
MSDTSSDKDLAEGTTKEKRRSACDRCRRLKRRGIHLFFGHDRAFYEVMGDKYAIRTVLDIQKGSHTRGYVQSLELRLKNAQKELRQPANDLVFGLIKRLTKPIAPPHPNDSGPNELAASFQDLFIGDPPPDPGFQGESSVLMMVKAAATMKPGRLFACDWRPAVRDRRPPPNPWIFKPGDVSKHLHESRDDFVSTLLLVCALGSLYLPDSVMSSQDRVKLAWTWYDQVVLCGHSLHRQPTTYDLQAYCDIGAFRRNPKAPTISLEEELEKRATWQLACALGRSTAIGPFDLDLGLPSECDDEWWQLSQLGNQPQDTPSTIAFFNCAINLYRIVHFLLKNFYGNPRLYKADRVNDLRALATDLDVAMGKWFSSIPQHLMWDPERPDGPFFDQSAALYCFYDYTRMLLHRPFILKMDVPVSPPDPILSSLAFSTDPQDLRALRIVTKTAYACEPLFNAAMVLIIGIWSFPQHVEEQAQNRAQVQTVLDIFKTQQTRWPSSGFFITVLEHLLALDHMSKGTTEMSEEAVASGDACTAAEVMGSSGHEHEPWIALAQAWRAGAALDRHSRADSDLFRKSETNSDTMPPVFAGDHEVGSMEHRYDRLRALLDLKAAEGLEGTTRAFKDLLTTTVHGLEHQTFRDSDQASSSQCKRRQATTSQIEM